ncbi:MAG: oxidoreductase [Candidatus Marinimicrobia bacterium]|nr:oxidoreductase [Candidatus Neomarinimicrobiota bacterium]|tara:strand:+ start:19420 stop:20346 length:927 start_codon:yes stop_codon:yes gene_type:complete
MQKPKISSNFINDKLIKKRCLMRTVLVTGVSTGIGKSITESLIQNKFHVIGSVRKEEDAIYLKKKYSKQFDTVIFDVRDEKAIKNAKDKINSILEKNNSYLCSIINNSGIALGGPVQYLDLEIFKKQFDVNFFGLISVTKIFLDLLIKSNEYPLKNKIINIGSISGKRSYPFVAPYTSSKFALEGFTDSLRRELMIHDIDVVLVQPGPIKTEIWNKVPDIEQNPFLNTEYGASIRKFASNYIKMGNKGFRPDIIGNRIVKILQTNKPKTRYVITPNKLINYLIPGFLPDRWVDRITAKILGLHKNNDK